MGIFDKYNVFPTLRTKHITIDHRGIVTVRGLLSTVESNQNGSTWLGTSDFTQYVKIYFAVITEEMNNQEFSRFFNSGTRFSNNGAIRSFIEKYKSASISLNEVLQNDFASSVGELDLQSGLATNDLSFEVDINMSQMVLDTDEGTGASFRTGGYWRNRPPGAPPEALFEWLTGNPEAWHLVGFIHFDFESFANDYRPVPSLLELGGNTTYDVLLEKGTDSSGNVFMKVPETTNAFFYAETWPEGAMHLDANEDGVRDIQITAQFGEPYFGPAYYDEGHACWYGGHQANPGHNDDPRSVPKLSVRNIPYNKVTANHLIRMPSNQGESYNGAPSDWFYNSYSNLDESAPPNINLRPADGDGQFLRQKSEVLGHNVTKTVKEFKEQLVFTGKQNNKNILFTSTASGIKVAQHPTSCHQIIAYMHFGNLLKIHSPLGWLIEYHAPYLNTDGETIQSLGSRNFLRRCIRASEIKNLKITRKRLSNRPEGNILPSSPDYITYDNDEIPETIVITSDQLIAGEPSLRTMTHPEAADGGAVQIADAPKAMIQDIGTSAVHRGFYLQDFDLFRNVAYGHYEYSADMSIVDGIKKVLEATINTYHRARSKVQEYLNRAMLPATYLDENPENIEDRSNYAQRILKGFSEDLEREKSSTVATDNFGEPIGYYDYKNKQYTSNLRTYADSIDNEIRDFVRAFVACYKILQRDMPTITNNIGGEPSLDWVYYTRHLEERLKRPEPGDIERYFDFFDNVANTLDRVLERGNISKYERTTSGLGETSLNTTKEMRLINITAKIPELVTAFSNTQIFYEPNMGSFITGDDRITTFTDPEGD